MTIENNIKEFEDLNGFIIPPEFKSHLVDFENFKLTNTIIKFSCNSKSIAQINRLFPFDSSDDSQFTVKALYSQLAGQFKNYIPIGNDHGGAFFIISTYEKHYGQIFFYSMGDDVENGQIVIAESFDSLMANLHYE